MTLYNWEMFLNILVLDSSHYISRTYGIELLVAFIFFSFIVLHESCFQMLAFFSPQDIFRHILHRKEVSATFETGQNVALFYYYYE